MLLSGLLLGIVAYLAIRAEGSSVWTCLSVAAWMTLIFIVPAFLLGVALTEMFQR